MSGRLKVRSDSRVGAYLFIVASGQLVDESDAIVAESHVENLGLSSPRHNTKINASAEVVPFLDLVVFSFIICEFERRSRNEQITITSITTAVS